MKLVAAILLVLSQVCLRSCRTRQSVSLVRDEGSSELTLVSPHKVPSLAQLIPILEGRDPPEAKISQLKKLIPIYDELNRWRLNNKKRLVEIIPYEKEAKPLAFILPGSNRYMKQSKKPNGPDKAPSEYTSSTSTSSEHHSHNPRKTHTSPLYTHKIDTIGSRAEPKTSENRKSASVETNNSILKNVLHTKYDFDSPEVNRNNDLDSREFNSRSNESESDEDINESDFGSNEQDIQSNDNGSASSDFKSASKYIKIDSDSKLQDSDSNKSGSDSNEDSESSETDLGYSSSKSNELYSDNSATSQEPELYSESSEPVLEIPIPSYINLDISKSVSLNLSNKSGSDQSSHSHDHSMFNESNLPEYDSNFDSKTSESTLELSDPVSASESELNSESNSESNESNSESGQNNTLTSVERLEKVQPIHAVRIYHEHVEPNEPHQSAVYTGRLNEHNKNNNEALIVKTTLSQQSNEIDNNEFNNEESDETYDPVATRPMVNRFHDNYDDKEEFIDANMHLVQNPHKNHDHGDESYEVVVPSPVTKKHHVHDHHGVHDKHDDYGDVVPARHPINKYHRNLVISSSNIKHHDNGFDYYELNDSAIGNQGIANQHHEIEEVDSDLTDEPVDENTPDNKHHDYELNNTDESNAKIDNESYDDSEPNETGDSIAARYNELLAATTQMAKTFNEKDDNSSTDEANTDDESDNEPDLLNEVHDSDEGFNDGRGLNDDPIHPYETEFATRRTYHSNGIPYNCKPNNGDESKDDNDDGVHKSKNSGQLLATVRRITEVESNRAENESPELKELPTDLIPALRKPGPKLRRPMKNYVLSFIFNR